MTSWRWTRTWNKRAPPSPANSAPAPTSTTSPDSPKRNVDFMRRYLKLPAEELLIGFTVAEHAGDSTLERAFTRAFDLRDDGGRWGIVASILEAPRGPLVAELEDLVVGTGVAGGGDVGADDGGLTFASGGEAGPGWRRSLRAFRPQRPE